MFSDWRAILVGGVVGFKLGQSLHIGKAVTSEGCESDDGKLYMVKHITWCRLHGAYHIELNLITADLDGMFELLGPVGDPQVENEYSRRVNLQRETWAIRPWLDSPHHVETFSTSHALNTFITRCFRKWQDSKQPKPTAPADQTQAEELE